MPEKEEKSKSIFSLFTMPLKLSLSWSTFLGLMLYFLREFTYKIVTSSYFVDLYVASIIITASYWVYKIAKNYYKFKGENVFYTLSDAIGRLLSVVVFFGITFYITKDVQKKIESEQAVQAELQNISESYKNSIQTLMLENKSIKIESVNSQP